MELTTKTTEGQEYADYLIRNQQSFRSTILQLPYRLHMKSLKLGKTLDIGCGAGRNLRALNPASMGIDHNHLLVEACKSFGFNAMTTNAFLETKNHFLGHFDSILLSHVAEHMPPEVFVQLLRDYRPFLRPGGRIIVLCPQERGYASDPTHVYFMDFEEISKSLKVAGFIPSKHYSFPFPRSVGTRFAHNEFVVIGTA